MTDPKFLKVVRAAIGAKNIPKKKLARRCKVSKPAFSEYLHGEREMPEHVRERLIAELGIQTVIERLNLC